MKIAFAATLATALVLALPVSAHEFKAGNLEIVHPWTRATPPGAAVGGGFVVIRNTGSEPDRLVGASAPFAGSVSVHEMTMEGDVMKMREVEGGLEIPAGGSVELKPGGFHMMFMDLKEPLKEGAELPGTLTFEKAGSVDVEWTVESLGATGAAHDGH